MVLGTLTLIQDNDVDTVTAINTVKLLVAEYAVDLLLISFCDSPAIRIVREVSNEFK